MENDKLEQFNTLKEELTAELADLDFSIGRIEQEYEQFLPDLKKRRDALVHVLFDEPPVEITLEDHGTDSASNSERLISAIKENPGASKKDLRNLLSDLSEKSLDRAIKWCSKNNLIENRGVSKSRPEWYLA